MVATALFFPAVARAAGQPLAGARRARRRRARRSLLFVAFTQFLGVDLPAGPDADHLGPWTRCSQLIDGFGTVLEPANLLFALLGVLLGTFVGVLPGIGPALTIALLLPLTFNFDDPVGAFILFAGIYFGGMYGGSTTSILLNTPGESGSVATAIEGFEMAKRGRAKPALATAAIGSFVAGTIGAGPAHVPRRADRRPRRAAAAGRTTSRSTVLAFVAVTALIGRSLIRGLLSLALGLAHRAGRHRPADRPGPAHLRRRPAVRRRGHRDRGGRAVRRSARRCTWPRASATCRPSERAGRVAASTWFSRDDARRSWKPWLRGTAFGFPFGAMPTGGAEIPTFLSYATERRLAKGTAKEEFGQGAIEGVAGPEAANNAAFTGVLVPLLTIGIPTSATAAILHRRVPDLRPPAGAAAVRARARAGVGADRLALRRQRDAARAQPAADPAVGEGARRSRARCSTRRSSVFATLGVYSISGSRDRGAWSPTPSACSASSCAASTSRSRRSVLGVILGPLMELQLRRTLLVSDGDWTALVERPFAAAVLAVALLALVVPLLPGLIARARGERFEGKKTVFGEGD